MKGEGRKKFDIYNPRQKCWEGRKRRSLTLTWNKVSRVLAPSNLSNPSHQEELGLVLA